MAAVYKTLSKPSNNDKMEIDEDGAKKAGLKKNKQRVLILSSRGVTYRYRPRSFSVCQTVRFLEIRDESFANLRMDLFRHRHLLNDLAAMLPHGRKDVKFDSKSKLYQLNELAELYNCNNVMFFEARKGKDLYMWFSKVPNGPTIKFHAQNCKGTIGLRGETTLGVFE